MVETIRPLLLLTQMRLFSSFLSFLAFASEKTEFHNIAITALEPAEIIMIFSQ